MMLFPPETKQRDAFLHGEGEAWLNRNLSKLPHPDDPVMNAIPCPPKRVLEVGCANGWRLELITKKYGCPAYGVDPMITEPTDFLSRGTAELLPYPNDRFDLVIYGFCLYLCDPVDYFRIVYEGDRVLQTGGHIIIWDFWSETPFRVPYHHKKGLYSHHMDFAMLWLRHPHYKIVSSRFLPDDQNVTVIKKVGSYP